MQRWLVQNRTHIFISILLVILMTIVSVAWASARTTPLRDTIRAPQSMVTENEVAVLSEKQTQDDEAEAAVEDEQPATQSAPSDPESSATARRAESSTTQEINRALNDLDLSGWEDELLSDEELGL